MLYDYKTTHTPKNNTAMPDTIIWPKNGEYQYFSFIYDRLFFGSREYFIDYIDKHLTKTEIRRLHKFLYKQNANTPKQGDIQNLIAVIHWFGEIFENKRDNLIYRSTSQENTPKYKSVQKELENWLDKGILLGDALSIFKRSENAPWVSNEKTFNTVKTSLRRNAAKAGLKDAIIDYIRLSPTPWHAFIELQKMDYCSERSTFIDEGLSIAYMETGGLSAEMVLELMDFIENVSSNSHNRDFIELFMRALYYTNKHAFSTLTNQKLYSELPITRKSVYSFLEFAFHSKYWTTPVALEYTRKITTPTASADFIETFKDSGLSHEKLDEIKKSLDESGLF